MDEWLELSDLVDRVEELLEIGLLEEAKKLLDHYLSLYHEDWEVYFLYARYYLEQNDTDNALPLLHKSLKLDNHNPDVLLGLYYTYAQMDQFKQAGKYILLAESLHHDNESILCALIGYHTERNKFDEAITTFQKALNLGSDNPETFRNAGVAYERMGQYDNAEHCLKTALHLNPQFEEVRDLLADHYVFVGQAEKSIVLYQDHLKESPRNIRTMSRLVFCLSQNEQPDEALKVAEETIRLYPNSPVGYVDLAYIYLNDDKPDLALKTAQKALDVSPIDAEAIRVTAIAYAEKDENDNAENAFESALGIEPENTEIIRDYYHHLRNVSKFDKMEKYVYAVIKLEQPYCIEDYWFLADYYREKGENLKSFHFLNKAYKCMPGEKELIPPMIDIMLDEGHTNFSLPFLMRYVEKNGWNEIINQCSRHKRLREKRVKEYIRFLRFFGQKTTDFRRYIYFVYFDKFMMMGISLLCPFFCFLSFVLWGVFGIPGAVIFSSLLFAGWKTLLHFTLKNPLPSKENLNIALKQEKSKI